jgi:hypothetical protein
VCSGRNRPKLVHGRSKFNTGRASCNAISNPTVKPAIPQNTDIAADEFDQSQTSPERRRRSGRLAGAEACNGRKAKRDQKLRRFRSLSAGVCRSDWDCRSPQANAPAKTTNIITTAAEISIDSIGITTSF